MNPYTVYVLPGVVYEVRELPGYIRQRVKRAIDGLADNPQPPGSKLLDIGKAESYEARRLRIDKWRIIYVVTESEKAVDVVAIRKRPPYDYGDLAQLLADLS